jgi:RNA polymerase sigma-70 factor (ECF subfamily)
MVTVSELAEFLAASPERLGEATRGFNFRVPLLSFAQFLVCRLDERKDPPSALADLHVADLYLTCACVEGIAGAPEAFVETFSIDIARVATKFARTRGVPEDDLSQMVMERLLVPEPEKPARLSLYKGTGPLRGFVQVTAARIVINARETKDEVSDPQEELFERLSPPTQSPETRLQEEQARTHLRNAFGSACSRLEPRDRDVLVYSICHGVSIDVLGRMYGVNRATAARWVQRARDQLVRMTRGELASKLALPEPELDSYLRGVLSRLELSVLRFLGESDP